MPVYGLPGALESSLNSLVGIRCPTSWRVSAHGSDVTVVIRWTQCSSPLSDKTLNYDIDHDPKERLLDHEFSTLAGKPPLAGVASPHVETLDRLTSPLNRAYKTSANVESDFQPYRMRYIESLSKKARRSPVPMYITSNTGSKNLHQSTATNADVQDVHRDSKLSPQPDRSAHSSRGSWSSRSCNRVSAFKAYSRKQHAQKREFPEAENRLRDVTSQTANENDQQMKEVLTLLDEKSGLLSITVVDNSNPGIDSQAINGHYHIEPVESCSSSVSNLSPPILRPKSVDNRSDTVPNPSGSEVVDYRTSPRRLLCALSPNVLDTLPVLINGKATLNSSPLTRSKATPNVSPTTKRKATSSPPPTNGKTSSKPSPLTCVKATSNPSSMTYDKTTTNPSPLTYGKTTPNPSPSTNGKATTNSLTYSKTTPNPSPLTHGKTTPNPSPRTNGKATTSPLTYDRVTSNPSPLSIDVAMEEDGQLFDLDMVCSTDSDRSSRCSSSDQTSLSCWDSMEHLEDSLDTATPPEVKRSHDSTMVDL
ncbi:mucin-5AC-like [Physella acuta]|uniref:mucin-5AC-like n=1 Tax=Physella acuta TaxID=109671 RepID=UPI0027DDDA26|nr:mucin-5AC-like [Physella acuta]